VTPEGGSDKSDSDPEIGIVLRPDMVELEDQALVPDHNLIRPAPTRFTHELVVDEPYYFDRPGPSAEPDGVLPAGTPVVVLVLGEDRSRVADASGRYVEVATASLRPLQDQ
jgi:hypothetical protein